MAAAGSSTDLWQRVDELVLRADPLALTAQKLGPLAARRLREHGRPVPRELALEVRAATLAMTFAPAVLRRVRATVDGPLVVFKGPEIARRYPGGARLFQDVDVLVRDVEAAHAALVAAGCRLVGEPERFAGIHHLHPLQFPELPLWIELHAEPKWPVGIEPPSAAEIVAAAVPSALGVEGVDAPAPAHHTLLLAAHAWAHEPLHTLRDLIDIAAAAAETERSEIRAVAERWRLRRVWRLTERALDGLFGAQAAPLPRWARHLHDVRERTVLEYHLQRWLSGFHARGAIGGSHALAAAVAEDFRSVGNGRTRAALRAVRGRSVPVSEYLEQQGQLPPSPRPRVPREDG